MYGIYVGSCISLLNPVTQFSGNRSLIPILTVPFFVFRDMDPLKGSPKANEVRLGPNSPFANQLHGPGNELGDAVDDRSDEGDESHSVHS